MARQATQSLPDNTAPLPHPAERIRERAFDLSSALLRFQDSWKRRR